MTSVARLYSILGPGPNDGQYLRHYDPESDNGLGNIIVTPDRGLAMRADAKEFMRLWLAVPKCHPVRETDGLPNRPLSAYTMEIEKAEADPKDGIMENMRRQS